jgi:hypothetical protein
MCNLILAVGGPGGYAAVAGPGGLKGISDD